MGGVNELVFVNCENDTVGFTWGIPTPAVKEFRQSRYDKEAMVFVVRDVFEKGRWAMKGF